MEWRFSIEFDKKIIRLSATIIYSSSQIERIRVSGRNRAIVFQSNRPLFIARGLKNRRLNWKLVEGTLSNTYITNEIIKSLENYLKRNTI